MATVHVGRLLGAAGFSRTVAIKKLHDQYAKDPEFVAMLLDEARIASHIRSPNVVQTLDVVAEHDELLLVMEYVEGDSVAHLMKLAAAAKKQVPFAVAASLVKQTLDGLHAAHEARDKDGEPLEIVHRDVSPQNVLVGIDGVARVLDFGIAKAASRSTSTEDGQIKGKTAYMAPEQLKHGAVDRRTDVFAAAVVFWELLAGRRLFYADTPAEAMSRVLDMPIDPPHKYAPDCPPELTAIALRGLERNPDDRFQNADEMAQAIEDAIVLARSKEVGAWVLATARGTLDERAALVQEVERSSHKMAAVSTNPELQSAIDAAERRRAAYEMPTERGHGPRSTPPPPHVHAQGDEHTGLATVNSKVHSAAREVGPPGSRFALVLGVAIACVGALALVAAVVLTRPGEAATVATQPSSAPPPIASAPPPPSAFVAPPPSASASAAP
ncbi:MAG TPA: serine/threonine-protein kinase, partial [Labilithrix sp.]